MILLDAAKVGDLLATAAIKELGNVMASSAKKLKSFTLSPLSLEGLEVRWTHLIPCHLQHAQMASCRRP